MFPIGIRFANKRVNWLITKEMLRSLILVIVIDLSDPKEIVP